MRVPIKLVLTLQPCLIPELVREATDYFGSQCIVVAIDAKKSANPANWSVGKFSRTVGRKRTGIDAVEWAEKMAAYGAGELLVTSMDRDGTKIGFDPGLTKAITERVNIRLLLPVASVICSI